MYIFVISLIEFLFILGTVLTELIKYIAICGAMARIPLLQFVAIVTQKMIQKNSKFQCQTIAKLFKNIVKLEIEIYFGLCLRLSINFGLKICHGQAPVSIRDQINYTVSG